MPDNIFMKLTDINDFILMLACDGDDFGLSRDEMDQFNDITDTISDILATHGLASVANN